MLRISITLFFFQPTNQKKNKQKMSRVGREASDNQIKSKYQVIIIIISLTPFELKAMRVSYKGLKLGKTLLFT